MSPSLNEDRNLSLFAHTALMVRQRRELAEFFGFETRNKYEIVDSQRRPVAFAAEQGKGILGLLARHFLGHWRTFEIHFFTPDRQPAFVARHPFRWIFQRLEVLDLNGRFLGAIQQRFAIFTKRFDVVNSQGQTIMEVSSPVWKPWTFPFRKTGRDVASVKKRWSGALTEIFTDKDNFVIEFQDASMSESERQLVLAAAMFIDLQYFERKAD